MILEIAALMADGKWVTGTSHEALAAREGVAVATVRHWAVDASRMLALADTARMKALRARNVERLDDAWEMALDATTVTKDGSIVETPDIRAGVAAIAEQNKLLGLIVERHEVTGAQASAEEYAALKATIAAELCDGCRSKLIERLRAARAPSTDEER